MPFAGALTGDTLAVAPQLKQQVDDLLAVVATSTATPTSRRRSCAPALLRRSVRR
jgi:hypothetical protein